MLRSFIVSILFAGSLSVGCTPAATPVTQQLDAQTVIHTGLRQDFDGYYLESDHADYWFGHLSDADLAQLKADLTRDVAICLYFDNEARLYMWQAGHCPR